MTNKWNLNKDNFERLLAWLDPDREQAGIKYEEIRQALINIFNWRGCAEAEDLADKTINRVTKKLDEIIKEYEGDPALYFYGVAKKIALEYFRQGSSIEVLSLEQAASKPKEEDDFAAEYECLEKCMRHLSPENRELLMMYYQEEGQVKIDARKDLAKRLNIGSNALRIRVYRLRATLEKCVRECLEEAERKR